MDLTQLGLPALFTDPWWLLAFALLPPLIVLGLWEGRTVRRRRVALGVARASAERWRARTGAILRAAIMSCVLLALAGLQIVSGAGPKSTVYLVDISGSVSQDARAAAHAYVERALAAAPGDEQAAVVLFAGQATVVRAFGATGPLAPFDVPAWDRAATHDATDMAGAIRLGLGLLPANGPRRLILLSDGLDTAGQAHDAAVHAAELGVPISVVPLDTSSTHEVAVESVSPPATVAAGQAFEVAVRVSSTIAEGAQLSLYQDDTLLEQRDVALQAGSNDFRFPVTAQAQGFHSYRAEVAAVDDRWAQNNAAAGLTVVQSEPQVLIVAGATEDADPLRVALTAAHVQATIIDPAAVPHTLTGLAAYDSVVLANAPAAALGTDTMQALQAYVRDLGRGLIMVGGEQSFGAGGYLNTPVEAAMPVSMQVSTPQRESDVALAMVVDKSGSMGRCHCGNSAAFRSTEMETSGVAKVDIAKQAILKAAAALAPTDRIGVVAFDTLSRWVVQMEPVSQASDLAGQISGIQAAGDTNIYAGLRAATDALEQTNAKVKHEILLTDGWSQDQTSYDALIAEMRQHNITLTTIAAGSGASDLLQGMATAGGGRYYTADDTTDVPQLFLKETVLATGAYLVEQPTDPALIRAGPIFTDIDTAHLPALLGYNSTTARPNAQVALAAPNGDPILAQWQYGLGRAVAWTPDMKGRWATAWVQWPQFPQFAAQLVGWTLPRGANAALSGSASAADGLAHIAVDAQDPTGAPRTNLPTTVHVSAPDGSISQVPLSETTPGHYEGTVQASVPGAYEVDVSQLALDGTVVATSTEGLVVPYPAEYQLPTSADAAPAFLRTLATASGGLALDSTGSPSAAPLGAAVPGLIPAWPFLLTLALLLFPLDVAVRRLTLGRRDWARFWPVRRR